MAPQTSTRSSSLFEPALLKQASWESLRKLHPHLFPPMELGHPGGKEALVGKVKTPFKVWTASSERDIETSKAWIRGAFPEWQRGDDGEGDGKVSRLLEALVTADSHAAPSSSRSSRCQTRCVGCASPRSASR